MTQTLVPEWRYRSVTGDLTTPQHRVLTALDSAVQLIGERLGRARDGDAGLELAERTERSRAYRLAGEYDVRYYPICTPVVGDIVIEPETAWGEWGYSACRYAMITYTGGWTAETLPEKLRLGICLTAKKAAGASADLASDTPAGAKSVAVGDVSVTYETAVAVELPNGVWPLIRGYQVRKP